MHGRTVLLLYMTWAHAERECCIPVKHVVYAGMRLRLLWACKLDTAAHGTADTLADPGVLGSSEDNTQAIKPSSSRTCATCHACTPVFAQCSGRVHCAEVCNKGAAQQRVAGHTHNIVFKLLTIIKKQQPGPWTV
jgi:hypothetical protein